MATVNTFNNYTILKNIFFSSTVNHLADTYPKRLYRSNQNQQKSNNMQVLWQVLVSLTQYT